MKLNCASFTLSCEFREIPLKFIDGSCENVFARKNNKTVIETLNHSRYQKLKQKTVTRYPHSLDSPLGKFLLELKKVGDGFYLSFLNGYGDRTYSNFVIADSEFYTARGIYAYFVHDELKYIGRCKDSMKKRINQGYGKIHPKNCYLDGQVTNCRLNWLITKAQEDVSLWFCAMDSLDEIVEEEKRLIRMCSPPWNKRN